MTLELITKNLRFRSLFWTQFFGALNDNFLKNALLILITFQEVRLFGMDAPSIVAMSGAIFILPFFIFSPVSGQLGERFDKAKIARTVKIAEIGIMILATVGFIFSNFSLLLFTLFLMGVHSAVFGPIKYSIIPELVEGGALISANAAIETGTFLAILIGTVAGGVVVTVDPSHVFVPLALLGFALAGYLTSRSIPSVPPAVVDQKLRFNPFPEIKSMYQALSPQEAVWNSILGLSWFWFLGAAILSILPSYVKDVLHGNESVATFFLAVFTVGIALGSVLCERLSFRRIEIGLVPFGSIGLSLFLIDLYFSTTNFATSAFLSSQTSAVVTASGFVAGSDKILSLSDFLHSSGAARIILDFAGIAISSGLFTVPLYALIQDRCRKEWLSRAIAMNNIMNALFMVTSALFLMALYAFHFSLGTIFLILGLLNAAVAIYIYMLVPEFTLRFLSWILVHLLYRLRVTGEENIPLEGAAVIVCNHVSYVDWLILSSAIRRPMRFVMYYKFAEIPLLHYLFRQAHVIPIAGRNEDPVLFASAFEKIHDELAAGELVCIFPEGQLTRDGKLNTFRGGIEHVLNRDSVPVIPVALRNFWGSLFSFEGGRPLVKAPKKLWKKIQVEIGRPVAASDASAGRLQALVTELLENERSRTV